MSDTAVSAGARLRSAREQRSMSLEKAAGELHLEPWVLETLEAGDYARIGPPVYGKGFLRRYATLLELPQDEILDGFGLGLPAVSEATGTTRETQALPALSPAQMLGGVAVVLLLGGLAWWKPWAASSKNPLPAAPATEPAATARAPDVGPDSAAAPEPARATERPAPAITRTLAAPTTAASPRPAVATDHGAAGPAVADAPSEPGVGRARLRLSFTSDSWVEVRDALGNKTFAGNGSANTVRTIAGQAPMHVYLRSGNGVQLEINGHAVAIGPQFFAGDVARFQAGADGVLRRESREASASNGRPPG